MAYMIFDTEKTYNYGYIIIDEKGTILEKQDFLITNEFNNSQIVGENTRKRKEPLYKDSLKCGSAEVAMAFKKAIEKHKINYIIAHNISEDKRNLEYLRQRTGIDIPLTNFYDSMKFVKIMYPENGMTNLESTVEDITGITIKQNHTALSDCELVYSVLKGVATLGYLPYFITYDEIFAKDNDYEITKLFFTNFESILPLPKNMKHIQGILRITDTGDKRKLNNFLKKYNFWTLTDCIEFSEKTGKPLKTPGTMVNRNDNTDEARILAYMFNNMDEFRDSIRDNAINCLSSINLENEELEELNIYKGQIYKKFEEDKKQKEVEFKADIKRQQNEFEEDKRRKEKEIDDKEYVLKKNLADKLEQILNGGLFNAEKKKVKKMLQSRDLNSLLDYFCN